jgi:serine/threonine protein kinase
VETDLTADGPDERQEPLPGAPAAIGDVLRDRWSVAEVHRGGQAWVLVVDDLTDGGRRAMKIPASGQLTGDAELVTVLGLEPHPHVVTALDVAEIEGRRAIVLDYVPETLTDLLRRRGPLPATGQESTVLVEICAGMAYLSKRVEFAHLDLKPSNVLVDDAGHARIADFGLARQVQLRNGRFPSASGGTWAYAAPEVLRLEPCDSRADVFSFGVMLYQACTGRLPYPFELAPTQEQQRAQLLDYYASSGPKTRAQELFYREQVATPTQFPVAAPNEEISDLLSGCLESDMAERHRSFEDLAAHLAVALGIPRVRPEPATLSATDHQRRELALCQALVRLERFEEAIRRVNRLATTSLLPDVSTAALRTAQEALTLAGRPDEAAALGQWW